MRKCLLLLVTAALSSAQNLDYLDPTVLQTKKPASVQQETALEIINKYLTAVTVEVDPALFQDNKDVFSLRTSDNQLHIKASTGVAAVWGFNYYLKKYLRNQIAWQVKNVNAYYNSGQLPEVNEEVVASDRFRYYQNVCTESYSFVWWDVAQWKEHVEWMALNGINLALAPIAQEAAWARIYASIGMTQEEIDQHFTGPAFVSWLRMGNLRGWGGPMPQSWHDRKMELQTSIVDYMDRLGIVPVFPGFNGHVPRAFARIYPNVTLHTVDTWNRFNDNYCCSFFLDPKEPLFATIGKMFIREITATTASNHIFAVDPFNEIRISGWSTDFVQDTAKVIFSTLTQSDDQAVWLVQNWMFVHDPIWWPMDRVEAFLSSVPRGRMLVLDLQSEQWPQYSLYKMYYGQPFIWCMLHNFGGTLGMFGSMQTINNEVHRARDLVNSTMIGIGLTPEGINQNYVVYDLMLEAGWRTKPVEDLETWVEEYSWRRYGCDVAEAWKLLLRSVYNFEGLNRMRGKYVMTRRPSFKIQPWAWYKSKDLFDALQKFAFSSGYCPAPGFRHDVVDITRQALQYRAEQFYIGMVRLQPLNIWTFNATANQFLGIMNDIQLILSTHSDFSISHWIDDARRLGKTGFESYLYEMNARNQITLWGPNGEISDYACKQWAEVFAYYYTPRWRAFIAAAIDAKVNREDFDERGTQRVIKETVEKEFRTLYLSPISQVPLPDTMETARNLYKKWAYVPDLQDLPLKVLKREDNKRTTLADLEDDEVTSELPTVTMLYSTNSNR
jgi:alpha-N-acetylglucosaminidase